MSPTRMHALPVVTLLVAATLAAAGCGNDTPAPAPTPTAALSSVSLNPSTVVAPNNVTGTVTLTASAPAGGATVALSSNNAAATLPSSVVVGAGSTTATFMIVTSGSGSVTITASYLGVSSTAQLTVNPGLVANFTVASTQPARRSQNGNVQDIPGLGAGTADVCPLVAGAGSARSLACRFDGGASNAAGSSITEYQWTYAFGTQRVTERSTMPVLTPQTRDCTFFGGAQAAPPSGGLTFISLTVELRVLNAQNQLSEVRSNQNIRIFPGGNCGYTF